MSYLFLLLAGGVYGLSVKDLEAFKIGDENPAG